MLHGGADCDGAEAGGSRNIGSPVVGILPDAGGERADALPTEEEVRRLGVPEPRELEQLREEKRRLKGLVADLSLDPEILPEVVRRNW